MNCVGDLFSRLVGIVEVIRENFHGGALLTDLCTLESLVDLRRNAVRTDHKARILLRVWLLVAPIHGPVEIDLHHHTVGDLIVVGGLPHGLLLL